MNFLTHQFNISRIRPLAFIIYFYMAPIALLAQSLGAFENGEYAGFKKFRTPSDVVFEAEVHQEGETVWSNIAVKTSKNRTLKRHKFIDGAPFSAGDGYLFILPVSSQYNPRYCYIMNVDGIIAKQINISKYEIVDYAYSVEHKLFCIVIDKFDNNIKKHLLRVIGCGVGWDYSSEVPAAGDFCEFIVKGRKVQIRFKLP